MATGISRSPAGIRAATKASSRRVVNQLGMVSRVHFLGPLFGTDKAAAYAVANAFILPSVSEGLPMVILEAWFPTGCRS